MGKLNNIIKMYNLETDILKRECEEREYNLILNEYKADVTSKN